MMIKKRLANGETLIGTFSGLPSPQITEMLGYAGFDYVFLDIEHGNFDRRSLEECLRAATIANVPCVARIPECSLTDIQAILDLGADGVQVAMVHDKETTMAASRFTHYPPFGIRGFSNGTRAARYCFKSIPEHLRDSNENVFVAVQIESRQGLENVDEILSVEGIDMIFVGIGDLMVSLGLPSLTDKLMMKIVKELGSKIRSSGKAAGIFLPDTAMTQEFIEMGYNMLSVYNMNDIQTAFVKLVESIKCQF
jgi:4-hydroxy-2-oxoheptanedioate aldolase